MHKNRLVDWETHLILQAQAGEQVAFELLMDTHREAIRNLALRMLRNPDDANDVIQETSLKAYRAIGSFQAGRPVLPWLLRIASNCCVDVLRQQRHPTESLDKHEFMLVDERCEIADGAESRISGELVRAAIERLPERYRRIVLMRHYRQMEVGEIATELNKPEGTVKSWLFRARALLKRDLQVALG